MSAESHITYVEIVCAPQGRTPFHCCPTDLC